MAQSAFPVHQGNVRVLQFRLRLAGTRDLWDVSTATLIELEVQKNQGVVIPAIPALITHPQADWANGLVAVEITPGDVTAEVGTYAYGLTVTISSEKITTTTGYIEVLDRPGYPPPGFAPDPALPVPGIPQHGLAGADHSATSIAALNAKVWDADLDDKDEPRDPKAHTHDAGDITGSITDPSAVHVGDVAGGGLQGAYPDPDVKTNSLRDQHVAGDASIASSKLADGVNIPSTVQKAAMDNANAPGSANPFATQADVGAGPGAHAVDGPLHTPGTIAGFSTKLTDGPIDAAGTPRPPTAHKSDHVTGGADAFAASDEIEAIVKRVQETSGPLVLNIAGIADGQFARRVGGILTSDVTMQVEKRTISAAEAAAKKLALSDLPTSPTSLSIVGGPEQEEGIDFVVVGGFLDWGGLGLDGVLAAGDRAIVTYRT